MYKRTPFKMYKIFEEIYNTRNYDTNMTYHSLLDVADPFNKIMLSEYIYYEYKYKYGYKRCGNVHTLNSGEKTLLRINNYNIKLKTENNYSVFFKYLNRYNNNLFVCDFENKDYFWLSILENGSLQKDKAVVKYFSGGKRYA